MAMSPSTARYDRVTKPADERPELVTGSIAWQPVPEGPARTIDLDAYFAKVWI